MLCFVMDGLVGVGAFLFFMMDALGTLFTLVILVNAVVVDLFLSVLSLLLSLLSCLVILLDVGNVAVVVAAADE